MLTDNRFPEISAMIMGWLGEPGYWSLFMVSFLASSLVPLGSEWLLVLLLSAHYPVAATVAVATAGNTLGACTSYLMGRGGSEWFIRKLLRVSPEQQEKAESWYRRYGSASLFFSWLPVVGDPICLAGGVLKVDTAKFLVLVASGKLVRYAVVAWAAIKTGGA